jgi:Meckel syndrome type 1 protein
MPDAPRTTSLTVLAGPLKGTRVVVEEAVDEVLIGSDAECRLALDVPGVSPLHARVWIDAQGATVHDTHSPRGVYVNDTRVEVEAPLADGDVLWLGPPGESGSVMIQFRQVPSAAAGRTSAPTAARPGDPLEEFVYDEPAGSMAVGGTAASDAVEFLLDDGPSLLGDAAAAGPTPAPPPAPAANPADDDLFFIEDASASPPAPPPPAPAPPAAAAPVVPRPAVLPVTAAPPAVPPPPPPSTVKVAAPAERPAATPGARPPAAPVREPSLTPEPKRPRRPPPPRPEPVRPAPVRPARGRAPSAKLLTIAAAGLVVVLGGGFALTRLFGAPSIGGIEPGRVRVGDAITLTGRNFSTEPGGNIVQFEGNRAGRVLQASSTRLQVEVPDIPSAPGRPNRVPVTVTVDGRQSDPMDIAVYLAPRVHGLAPSVAMPAEEVVLAGTGWGPGATVTFGGRPAEVLEATASALRVRVPAIDGPPGTSAPVVVTMAGETSNPAPFLIGHLPLLLSLEPKTAAPGDLLLIAGRGFQAHAGSNDVRIGGTRALVTSASDGEIRVMVPWVPPGAEVPLDVKVPGSDYVGQAVIGIHPPADPVEFRFSAEPLVDAPDHDHAVVSTGLGPAFVVSAAGGRSAAVRAAETVRRLNEAAAPLKASLAQDVEMRGLDLGSPAIVLTGSGETLLDITDEDAAGYNEDWTRQRGRGGPVTRARLAVWWGAVARDLVRLLVRGEAPQHAALLAPEGRVLGELHAAARKTGRFGIPRDVVEKARPALREGLRTLAMRVPAAVTAPVEASPTSSTAAAPAEGPPAPERLELEGDWTGRENEGGAPRHVIVTFTSGGGTLSYQRALSLSLPLIGVQLDRRGNVRYSMQTARGARYYVGRWDGQKIEGRIFSDPEGQSPIGTFTLERGR